MKKLFYCLILSSYSFIYAQDGTLDPSFGDGGKLITNINNDEKANGLIIQSDGKIVVAGYTYTNTYGNDVVCIRYNSDGSLDQSFGFNGIATFDIQLGSDDKALAIDIQNDGKLILGGYSDNGSDKEALLMRLNSDGSLDTSFGDNGKILTGYSTNGIPVRQDEYRVVKIHHLTGNIVVGGTSYSASNNSRAIVARYTSTGTLDETFANEGKFTGLPNSQTTSNYLFSIEDLAIKSNGKITLVGWSNSWFYLGRLNANGTMDTTFSSDGYNHLWGGRMYGIELNNDDSFYFTGDIWTAPETQLYTGRINANGGGITATPFFFGSIMAAYSFAIEKDTNDKLIVAGYLLNENTNQSSFLVGRLLADHSIDNTFGNNGFTTTPFNNSMSRAYDMKIQADGKIVLAGFSGNNIALARYNGGVLSTNEPTIYDVQLYPNPAKDYIHLNFENKIYEKADYQILDTMGRIVKTGNISGRINKINISSLNKGVYFFRIESKNINLKFIKI